MAESSSVYRTTNSRKSRKLTYPDVIARDSGIRFEDLAVAMQDRNTWRDIVGSISTAVER